MMLRKKKVSAPTRTTITGGAATTNTTNTKTRCSAKMLIQILLVTVVGIYLYFLVRTLSHDHHPQVVEGAGGKVVSVSSSSSSLQQPLQGQQKLPPLSYYIQGWNITKNVNWLLDFAIVGFPKAGTSTLMLYLQQQTQSVFIFPQERCELGYNQHVPLLVDLYKNYHGSHIKMGIKCPRDLEVDLALHNYETYFPNTKFIIGIRNPISWFVSFYNFRIVNEFPMPPSTSHILIGKCKRANQGVCTSRANFTNHLSKINPGRNVFLYHVDQLNDVDPVRSKQFLVDLSNFLQLSIPMNDPMIWIKPGQNITNTYNGNVTKMKEIQSLQISNICDPKYDTIRNVLYQLAIESSNYIRTRLLDPQKSDVDNNDHPNVVVSSRDYFLQLLNQWKVDPCSM